MGVNVLYLCHDLDDAAVWRRASMLSTGGAQVRMAGFRRGERPLPGDAIVLGRTIDARLGQRAMTVLQTVLSLRYHLAGEAKPDVILARNLEMLVLARAARRIWRGSGPAIAYEVLDIHRLMAGNGFKARMMRGIERQLMRGTALVLTSSPAFVVNYFAKYGQSRAPIRIVENRYFEPGAPLRPESIPEAEVTVQATDAIAIGWFGILRCSESLACLDAFTRARPGRYVVHLRGKPALDALPHFHEIVAANPDFKFHGPYRYPEDLPSMYRAVDFAWLLDCYDAGLNSAWLLPNRLYEGCRFGAVPIAQAGTATAAYIQARGLGITVESAAAPSVEAVLGELGPDQLESLRAQVRAVDPTLWTATADDCVELVDSLRPGVIAPGTWAHHDSLQDITNS
ncbi:MAG: glycosyl transferase [bacterium]|nr:glycosyl transferase [bacterium]